MRDDEIVLISETKTVLTAMLDQVGVRPVRVDEACVPTTVEVFRRFAAEPVDDAASSDEDGDGVLGQFGTCNVDGVTEFSADLTRQFIGMSDGEIWQLHCTYYWTPSAVTEALGAGSLWSFGMPLDDFFTQALVLPGWAWALTGTEAPQRLAIELEQV